MSEELERETLRAKNRIKQEFCGQFLMFLGNAMASPGKMTPEDFMKTVSNRILLVRDEMENVNIAAEEGIVLNEKGEAVKAVPVKKEKPIKKVTVTRKNIGDLWGKIQGEIDNFIQCYPDGLQTDKVLKENIGTMLGKFVDDNRL